MRVPERVPEHVTERVLEQGAKVYGRLPASGSGIYSILLDEINHDMLLLRKIPIIRWHLHGLNAKEFTGKHHIPYLEIKSNNIDRLPERFAC